MIELDLQLLIFIRHIHFLHLLLDAQIHVVMIYNQGLKRTGPKFWLPAKRLKLLSIKYVRLSTRYHQGQIKPCHNDQIRRTLLQALSQGIYMIIPRRTIMAIISAISCTQNTYPRSKIRGTWYTKKYQFFQESNQNKVGNIVDACKWVQIGKTCYFLQANSSMIIISTLVIH